MLAVKKAIWMILSGDTTLAAMLNSQPYMGRLPDTAKITREKGAVSISGDTTLARGDREDQTLIVDVWTLTHDLAESIYERLLVLLHPVSRSTQWRALAVSPDRAFIRLESAFDLPDSTSELFHKAIRFRVLYARKFA